MQLLYNISLNVYTLTAWFVSPFNEKARLWCNGRRRSMKKIRDLNSKSGKLAWFHCASLGEFEQGRPLIEYFRKSYPDYKILLTFYSPSGYEVRKNYQAADYVFYLPMDINGNAKKFVKKFRPDIAFFVKYEFWRNYTSQLKKHHIPFFLVSGIFRENQHFFKWYGGWFRSMLKDFTHIFVQDDHSCKLIESIGIENVTVSGDTRFDRVYEIAKNAQELPLIEIFKNNKPVFVAGSTWEEDEKILSSYFNSTNTNLKLIIAPHLVEQGHLRKLHALFSIAKKIKNYSESDNNNLVDADILIIDIIGILSSVYRYADICYVGGAFRTGLHNILEPATHGKPVLFGPEYQKFNEAKELIQLKGVFSIKNEDDFSYMMNNLLNNPELISQAGDICKNYIAERVGATKKIFQKISFESHV